MIDETIKITDEDRKTLSFCRYVSPNDSQSMDLKNKLTNTEEYQKSVITESMEEGLSEYVDIDKLR
jgi:hypothetical protein